ncbi:hypothetical protein GGG16DRAFT_128281 [Schizophyllum commune]
MCSTCRHGRHEKSSKNIGEWLEARVVILKDKSNDETTRLIMETAFSFSVEKGLFKRTGETRHDLGRENYMSRTFNQLCSLGGSYDWSRKAYTMDPPLYRAVIENFSRCVRLNTTSSNLEVDQQALNGREFLSVHGYKEKVEFGVITSFAYPIEDSETAIAVHPDDAQCKHLHGEFAIHPSIPGRKMPIITDAEAVDMEFVTGAVKITPAHDPNDYAVGTRHNLAFINTLNDDGTLNENAGEKFAGMPRFKVRVEVVKALEAAGLFVEKKDNPMQIPICSKSGNYRWLAGISRQLWWGHRVPAYIVNVESEEQDKIDGQHWVVGRTLEEATERAKAFANDQSFALQQDEDVLDTWFSSGLWPFSSMGWPENTFDYRNFYPSSILETGWDILFFWVARMVMLGLKLTDQMPFREMSKSLGNVIDPLDVIQGCELEKLHEQLLEGNLDEKEIKKAKEGQKKDFPKGIPQCGTDALRFALCAYSGGGRDINLEILRVEGYRKFCNKIFNATKFAMLKLDESFVPQPTAKPTGKESLVEKWILHKLNVAAKELNTQMTERNFMMATTAAYNFWLYELCDVYIEAMKPMTDDGASVETRRSAQETLYTCLDHGLRLLHSFMPFVTEELWQRLPRRPNDPTPTIMLAKFPESSPDFTFDEAEKQFDLVFSALKTGRSSDADAALFESQVPTIVALTKGCESVKVARELKHIPEGCGAAVVTPTIAIHTLVRGLVDFDVEISKCDKKLDVVRLALEKIVKTESQADYEQNDPENVRAANADKRRSLEADIATLKLSKEMFAKLK